VFETADAGDAVAAGIVPAGRNSLAAAVVAAGPSAETRIDTLPLALAGGVLLASPSYAEKVLRALQRAASASQ